MASKPSRIFSAEGLKKFLEKEFLRKMSLPSYKMAQVEYLLEITCPVS